MGSTLRNKVMERKIIRISEKRQVTIPQKFYKALNMSNEAECVLQSGAIIIRPIKENIGGEFAEQILSDLIAKGYEGPILLEKFKETNKKIRPAVETIMAEAENLAKTGGGATMHDVFGTED